jgi:hypothetical protein
MPIDPAGILSGPWRTSDVLLMFMAFLPPSFMPPNNTIQVAGNLGYYWGPSGGLPWGNRSEHMLGHLGCLQGHEPLELPMLSAITLQY